MLRWLIPILLEMAGNFACLLFGGQLSNLKLGPGKSLVFSKLYAK